MRNIATSIRPLLILVALAAALAGCSIRRLAVGVISDSLAGGGDVYASDDDPDLVREAIPFGLKTYEGLLDASPDDRRLLLALAKGFTVYAYLLQDEADRIDAGDRTGARRLRDRAARLYRRGRDYALRGLEVDHPGFEGKLRHDRAAAIAGATVGDVPLLYWAAAGWAGAVSANPDDLDLVAELPLAGALMDRVLALDESHDGGAAHQFFISFEGSRPGGSAQQARKHFDRALALSKGRRASVYVALAESVSVREQNLAEFRTLIAAALAVDPDRDPAQRIANTIAIRRARWLESRESDLFVTIESEGASQ